MFKRSVFFVAIALCLITTGCNNVNNKKMVQEQTGEDILEVISTNPKNPQAYYEMLE